MHPSKLKHINRWPECCSTVGATYKDVVLQGNCFKKSFFVFCLSFKMKELYHVHPGSQPPHRILLSAPLGGVLILKAGINKVDLQVETQRVRFLKVFMCLKMQINASENAIK